MPQTQMCSMLRLLVRRASCGAAMLVLFFSSPGCCSREAAVAFGSRETSAGYCCEQVNVPLGASLRK